MNEVEPTDSGFTALERARVALATSSAWLTDASLASPAGPASAALVAAGNITHNLRVALAYWSAGDMPTVEEAIARMERSLAEMRSAMLAAKEASK